MFRIPSMLAAGAVIATTPLLASAPAWAAPAQTARPAAVRAASHPAATTQAMKRAVTVKLLHSAKYGEVLVDQAGKALYYDTANKLPHHWACTGGCLSAWPPLVLGKGQMAPDHAKSLVGLGTVHGPRGLQVTWHGKPLYTFSGDKKGTVKGQGFAHVWYVAHVGTAAKKSSGSGW